MCFATGPSQHLEIDFGGLVNAIYVESNGILGLFNITARNIGPKALRRPTENLQYKIESFGPWPSIQVAPGATVGALS